MSSKMKKLYEGKAKIIFSKSSNQVVAKYKDDATAFNNLKKGSIKNKGIINNIISSYLFEMLNHCGVPTHKLSSDYGTFSKPTGGYFITYKTNKFWWVRMI